MSLIAATLGGGVWLPPVLRDAFARILREVGMPERIPPYRVCASVSTRRSLALDC